MGFLLVNNWDFNGILRLFGVKVANVRIQPRKNRIEPVDYGDLRPNPIGFIFRPYKYDDHPH